MKSVRIASKFLKLRNTMRQVAVETSYSLRLVGIGANVVTESSPTLVNIDPTRT